jgi:prevent-host-death family protein
MRTFSSANAKNNFGELVDAARIAPVAITKYNKPVLVLIDMKQFSQLTRNVHFKDAKGHLKRKRKAKKRTGGP